MQSETWIKKAGFRSETTQLKKHLFNPRVFDYDFQLDQTAEKTEIYDPTRQSNQNVPPHTRTSITHPHNIGDAGLAAVTSTAARRESA